MQERQLNICKNMEIVERFINYTKFDTQSAEDSETVPSTPKQLIFANYLKDELEREGLKDVEIDDMGYLCNAPFQHEEESSNNWIHFSLRYSTRC